MIDWTAMLWITAVAGATGLLLGASSRLLRVPSNAVADRIEALLPHTQCGQCGYPGCRPYAEAVAQHEAAINLCPPGGTALVRELARLLDRPVLPEPQFHHPGVVAVIDEEQCIGCTFCAQACPVDAIIGAQHTLHTVLQDECTGCELCLAPCPVDCITLLPPNPQLALYRWPNTAPHDR